MTGLGPGRCGGYIPGVVQRRFHYDQAFEHYLRANAIPYVAVDEARKALRGQVSLKNFDFVVYGESGRNLLVDVKGRKHSGKTGKQLHNWVTADDVRDLLEWQKVFGAGFAGAFVFLYWCEAQPPDALFHEIYEYHERWYSVLGVLVDDYAPHTTRRSAKWNTVSIPSDVFARISRPLGQIL